MHELFEDHLSLLTMDSSISQEVIQERGYRSLEWTSGTDEDYKTLKDIKIPPNMRPASGGRGILIPSWGSDGELGDYQWRSDEPMLVNNPKTKKEEVRRYASARGGRAKLDIHPLSLEKVKRVEVPLILTEGVKKADSLTSRGLTVIALKGVFNWRNQFGSLGDWEEIPLKGRHVTICFDSDAVDNEQVMRAMVRCGKWLKFKGANPNYLIIPKLVEGEEVKGVDDYFSAGGTWSALESLVQKSAPDYKNNANEFSDLRLAETVAEEVLLNKYVVLGGRRAQWYKYDGKSWNIVTESEPMQDLVTFVKARHSKAFSDWQSGKGSKDDVDGWGTMHRAGRLNSVLSLAATFEGVAANGVEFDADVDLLNCQNGIVDLRTGQLLPHDPSYLMTKITNVSYDPSAMHEDWEKALGAVPSECLDWLQVRCGNAITGRLPDDDVVVLMCGRGENGKSTIVDAVQGALGSYYRLISPQVLMSKGRDAGPEAYELMGLRWAQLEETAENGRLDANKVKQATGAQINVTPKYMNTIVFDATHTLFISTNNPPIINETDHGSWRRFLMTPFPYTFVKPHVEPPTKFHKIGDPTLKHRVKNDPSVRRAVLAWLVAGAQKWYEGGEIMPAPPTCVADRTKQWKMEVDQVLQFLTEFTVMEGGYAIRSEELLEEFREWQKARGSAAWGPNTFLQRMQGHHDVISGGVEFRKFRTNRIRLSKKHDPNGEKPTNSPQLRGFVGVRFKTKEELTALTEDTE